MDQTISVDGIDYFTLLEGPPSARDSKPPILLIHAIMSNNEMYDETVKALTEKGMPTLRFDHVGHNKTPPPKEKGRKFHMDDVVRHMHEIVKKITGDGKLKAVIGCSIGGVMALRYAMLYPEDVEKCVSIAAPGIKAAESKKALWADRLKLWEKTGEDGISEELCKATVERWTPGEKERDKETRQKSLEHVRTCSFEGYRLLADAIRGYDYSQEVGKVKCPTLVIVGSEDGAADANGMEAVAKEIGDGKGEFWLMKEAGHLPPMHMSEEFNERVVDFLDS